jgi:hypothetical protein
VFSTTFGIPSGFCTQGVKGLLKYSSLRATAQLARGNPRTQAAAMDCRAPMRSLAMTGWGIINSPFSTLQPVTFHQRETGVI